MKLVETSLSLPQIAPEKIAQALEIVGQACTRAAALSCWMRATHSLVCAPRQSVHVVVQMMSNRNGEWKRAPIESIDL